MPSNMPQNGEEAAYISFALVHAFGNMLVSKDIISQGDFAAVFEAAAIDLATGPNSACKRGSEFLRRTRPGKE